MVAQLYDYTKNQQIVRFKRVKFKVCKFYLNKAIIKNYTCDLTCGI